jgi:UDP-N-acetyl-D-mannosaminuronate dehydrogenase
MARLGVVVGGGCGPVGLPSGLAFASRGINPAAYDTDQDAVAKVSAAQKPFNEPGAPDVL